jgi:hypothetical protein
MTEVLPGSATRSIRCALAGVATALLFLAPAAEAWGGVGPRTPPVSHASVDGIPAERIAAPRGFFWSLTATLARRDPTAASALRLHAGFVIPSFSRQTKLPCAACHYQFPELTPFGRLFKLNGYTLTGLVPISSSDTTGNVTLALAPIPPASAMVVASVTRLARAKAGTQNNTAQFPQQASLFFGGQIAPKVGAFTQFTYTQASGSIGMDNIDLRFATHTTFASHDLLAGITLHNNPTVQDVWNTVPAWGYPFMSSAVAPSVVASTLIDGALATQVVGLGAYSLYDNMLYTELTAYRSAPQGTADALDSTAVGTTNGVIPYWRVALQHQTTSTYLMLGTYGFSANLYPQGVTGATNRFTDIAADAQIERLIGTTTVIGRATLIDERRNLGAFVTASPALAVARRENLSTLRANVSVLPSVRYALTLGYVQTTGTADTLLFTPDEFSGSRTGSPRTSGVTGEVTFNPWQNLRLSAQYLRYRRFNGSATAYDVAEGRRASDNNTLFLYTWVAF